MFAPRRLAAVAVPAGLALLIGLTAWAAAPPPPPPAAQTPPGGPPVAVPPVAEPIVHPFDIRNFGAVPDDPSPATAARNAAAIQAAIDAAKGDRDRRWLATNRLYENQRGEVFIPGRDFYLDRPLHQPGHLRIFGPPGVKGRLLGTRHMPILVMGPPTGQFANHQLYGAYTRTRHVDLHPLGFAPAPGRLWGYDLTGDSIYLRTTGFDLPQHAGPILGLGVAFATKADYAVSTRLDFARMARGRDHDPSYATHHLGGRSHFQITTADGVWRRFSAAMPIGASESHRILWEFDPAAGTVACWIDGTYRAVDRSGAGANWGPGLAFRRADYDRAIAGPGRFVLAGLKLSRLPKLDPAAPPGTPLKLTDAQVATAVTGPGVESVLPPTADPTPGLVPVRHGTFSWRDDSKPGWALWWAPQAPAAAAYCEVENIAFVNAVPFDNDNLMGSGILGLDPAMTTVTGCDFRRSGFGYDGASPTGVHPYGHYLTGNNFDRNGRAAIQLTRTTAWVERCVIQYAGDYSILVAGAAEIRGVMTLDSGKLAAVRVYGLGDSQQVSIRDCNFGDEDKKLGRVIHATRMGIAYNPGARQILTVENNGWSGHRGGDSAVLLDAAPSNLTFAPSLLRYRPGGLIGRVAVAGAGWVVAIDDDSAPVEVADRTGIAGGGVTYARPPKGSGPVKPDVPPVVPDVPGPGLPVPVAPGGPPSPMPMPDPIIPAFVRPAA